MKDYMDLSNTNFPIDTKVCNFISVSCNPVLQVGNYYIARPYNFFMSNGRWARVKNDLELLLALRYGFENDLNKLGDDMMFKSSFNTMMYIKFQAYVRKHAMKEAVEVVAEFQKTTFSLRLKTAFSPTDALLFLGVLKSMSVPKFIVDAKDLAENAYRPIYINRAMYNDVFGRDYHLEMVKQMQNQGIYRGEGDNSIFKEYGY